MQKTKSRDGVTWTTVNHGQKRAYGDHFYEYVVESNLDAEAIERFCCEHVYKCDLTHDQYLKEYREKFSMDKAFRHSYTFKKTGPDKYFYCVTYPYAD